ncbi:MAG: DUF922 domain-containing protein [Nitrospirae bacterium]|nr:DUF922 domain-containing protein [Nitrospirota bacterium]
MKLSRFVSACIMVLASASLSESEISQHFDRTGRLLPAERRLSPPQSQKMKKYSVPEGIELRPDVHYEFYPVFGKTFAEIVKSTEENSPLNAKTRRRQPSTYDWNLGWTYDFSFSLEPDEENEKVHCDFTISGLALAYNLTITLPALTDDSALNPMEKELWKNYITTLLERAHGRIKIIKDDTNDDIVRQFSEIAYLALSDKEAENAEKIIERFVRTETEKIGRDMVRQIQQKLEAYDSASAQDIETVPARTPARRRITR